MYKIFPCGINKRPLLDDWQTEATTDQVKINQWHQKYGAALTYWGIPTGKANNILALDIDKKKGKDGYATLSQNHLDPGSTAAQTTVSGGKHYLYTYPTDGKRYGNRVDFLSGLDIRGEGGYVIHYGLDKAPLTQAPGWLLKRISSQEIDHTLEPIKVSEGVTDSMVSIAIDNICNAAEGERNHTLNKEAFRVAQLVKGGSIGKEYAINILMSAAKDIDLPTNEALATITSAFKGGEIKPMTSPFTKPDAYIDIPDVPIPEVWTPKQFSVFDLMDTSNLRRPQLFEHWSTQDIHLTTADGGTGKTTLKLYEAICLALGEPFLGFKAVTSGKTLFITGEDTKAKLGAMIGQILKQMGHINDSEKLNKVLSSIIVKKDSDLCLISKNKLGFLTPNGISYEKVLSAVTEIKPKLIVFDPISSFWGSEAALNDMAKAVTRFMGDLTEYSGACVEMINHMGKVSSSSRDMSQFAGRGGTGLPSHARVSRVLRPIDDKEYLELTGTELDDKQSAMMCNVNKFTDGSPLLNKPFLILREGYLFRRIDIAGKVQREEQQQEADTVRVLSFINECRSNKQYATNAITTAYFQTQGVRLSEKRIKHALSMLQFEKKIKPIEHPDQSMKDRAFVPLDEKGNEI